MEQRILEQAQRLPPGGAVGGWASLPMHGAAYFDGVGHHGDELPVALVVPPRSNLRPGAGSVVVRPSNAPRLVRVHGVPCLDPVDALIAVAAAATNLRAALVAVDMTLAARVVELDEVVTAAAATRRRGVSQVRVACRLADRRSLSPPETVLRLLWAHAGLPRPHCNWTVHDLDGRFLGVPDTMDPDLGLVGEYDGAAHRSAARHRADERRKELFRGVGLEVVTVVGLRPGDEPDVVRRLRAAADRARRRTGPPGWQAQEGRLPG